MMKSQSKTYQLARRCLNDSQNIQPCLRSLPSYISEEEGFNDCYVPFRKEANIFNQNLHPHQRKIDLNHEANYRYVGIREIKSYQSRGDKKKRNMNSFNKRASESAMTLSRLSNIKQQASYLTKQDLLKQFYTSKEASILGKENQLYLQDKSSLLLNASHLEKTVNSQSSKPLLKQLGDGVMTHSLSKIKHIMQKYENGWSEAIKARDFVRREKVGHKKYRSVLENAAFFREKVEQKEKNELLQKTINVQPNEWELVLHNAKSLKSIHQKQMTQVSSKGMKVIGRKKCAKELAWIEEKDRQGCFFKVATTLNAYSRRNA